MQTERLSDDLKFISLRDILNIFSPFFESSFVLSIPAGQITFKSVFAVIADLIAMWFFTASSIKFHKKIPTVLCASNDCK